MIIQPEYLILNLFEKKTTISFNNSKLHKAFYKKKKDLKYAEIYKNITFSGSPVNPFSEVLDEALFNLQFSDCLSRKNPGLIEYSKNSDFNSSGLGQGLTQDQLNLIQELCNEVLQLLSKEKL